jgi:hypothetical protein
MAAAAADYSRYRIRSRMDELPPEARERIDEMLASQKPYYTYQDISDALSADGFAISKSSIGRYVARQNASAREVNMVVRQTDALLRWMEDHPTFDAAQASLALLTGRLSDRLISEPDLVKDISPDKAVTRIIQAARTSAIMSKISEGREDEKAKAKQAVMDDMREVLHGHPELFAQLQDIVVGQKEAGA